MSEWDSWFRQIIRSRRALPNCFIICGTNCGTTTLYDIQSRHDRLGGSVLRGVHHVEQVRRFLNRFPKELILFTWAEKKYQSPADTLNSVCQFVGVEPLPSDLRVLHPNVGIFGADVPATITESPTGYFRPHNRELFDLLGRRFDRPT